jgi:ribosome-associated protein
MAEEKKKRFTKRSLPAPVRLAVEAALARKAEELCVLDLRELSSFTDFFIVTNGNSSRQNIAVAEAIEAALKPAGSRPIGIEGRESAEWVLLDYGSFVIHVFSKAARDHYALEKLWGDAPRLAF